MEKSWEAFSDFDSPVISVHEADGATWDEPGRVVRVSVADSQPAGIEVQATLDSSPVEIVETSAPAPAAKPSKKRTAKTTTTTLAPPPEEPTDGRTRYFVVQLGDLSEGGHQLMVESRDRGGHSSSQGLVFAVDSTDTFGSRPMGPGAKGRDARQLNQVLVHKGFLEGKAGDVFDERTTAALVAFRKDRGKGETPVLDKDLIPLLVGSIKIDISERKLYHYDEGKLVKTYAVAVGQPRYPTPRGDYYIIVKEYNPTWNPPPSPWAEGLEPVPPGPGNPLGTRWMGLSAPAVGIHGTYASGSIGTAASHGCIRMRIRDVEELFERVYVGTPVQIVS
jgi:hypothetical protein